MNKEDKYRVLFGNLIGYEYINGACLTFENSQKHIKYSEIAFSANDYGFGISHLVLGAEELIKALILICLHRDESFISDSQKEKLFSNHSFKHLNIKELLKALTELSVVEFESEQLYYLPPNSLENKFRYTGFYLAKALGAIPVSEDEIDSFCKLIDEANHYKNQGFYVDFKQDWIDPSGISEQYYLTYYNLLQKLNSYISPLFTMPMSDDRLQYFIYNE